MNIRKNPNILENLYYNEDSLTRILYALCSLKLFRNMIIEFFTESEQICVDINFEDIYFQYRDSGIIFDLYIENKYICIAIEIKTSQLTALTPNQPEYYLEWLSKRNIKNKYFVFIAPEQYGYEEKFNSGVKKFTNKFFDNKIKIVKKNWVELYYYLSNSGLSEISMYVQDFNDILFRNFIKELYFTYKELGGNSMYDKDIANGIVKLFILIEDLCNQFENNGFIVQKNFRNKWWGEEGSYDFSLYINENTLLGVGLWTHFWKEHGCPLCIYINKNCEENVCEDFKNTFPEYKEFNSYGEHYWLVQCIDKELLIKHSGDSDDAVKKIMKFIQGGELKFKKLSSEIDNDDEQLTNEDRE